MTEPLRVDTLYMVAVSPVTHFYGVCEPSNTTGWYKYYTQKRARLAHPYLQGIVQMSEAEWLEALHKRALPVVLNEQPAVPSVGETAFTLDGEQLYLVCMGCGEAFESNEPVTAYQHWNTTCDRNENYDGPCFEIMVESEAF
jgi:hypothetical protein